VVEVGDTPTILKIGYSKRDITPPPGSPLAGRPMLVPRNARVVHDHLHARAAHIASDSGYVTLLAVDLLLVTNGLHSEIAQEAGVPPEKLLVFATHTHSGFGGFWRGRSVESFMGRYSEETRTWLVKCLAGTVQAAASAQEPARLSATSRNLLGMSANRRQVGGAVDPTLTILRFDTDSAQPIFIVSYGAHPIVGLEREPITADYPGEVCRRLEARGMRAMLMVVKTIAPAGCFAGVQAGVRPGEQLGERN
jgi:neutral ceramidase